MTSETAEQMEISGDNTNAANTRTLAELMSEGQKMLVEKDIEAAVELLSEAAQLADETYDSFSPEVFDVYMLYGRSLIDLALDQVFKADINGQFENGDDEVAPIQQPAVKSDADKQEESLNEHESVLSDAWDIFEVAKQVCEKQLKIAKEDADIRKWKLNLTEPLYYLGRVLILSGNPEAAKVEFTNSLDIKKQYLDSDRILANALRDVAKSFEEVYMTSDAKPYFEQALDVFTKLIALLETDKTNEGSASEIDELKATCAEIKAKIDEAAAQLENSAAIFNNVTRANFSAVANPGADPSVNDITHLIKRRRNVSPTNTSDIEAKKSKLGK